MSGSRGRQVTKSKPGKSSNHQPYYNQNATMSDSRRDGDNWNFPPSSQNLNLHQEWPPENLNQTPQNESSSSSQSGSAREVSTQDPSSSKQPSSAKEKQSFQSVKGKVEVAKAAATKNRVMPSNPSHTEISSAANNLFPVHQKELHNVPMKSGYKLSPNPNSNQEWPSENSSQTLLNKLPRCDQSGSSSTSNSKANSEPTKNPVEGLGFIQNTSENLDSVSQAKRLRNSSGSSTQQHESAPLTVDNESLNKYIRSMDNRQRLQLLQQQPRSTKEQSMINYMVRENEKARARQLSSIRYRLGSDELQSILNAENTVVQPKDLVDEFEELFSRNDKETTNQQDSEEEEVQVFEPPPKTPPLCINLDDTPNTPEAEAPTNKADIITIVRAVPRRMRPKLLKFHENRRPAYWGTWGKTSHTVGPRSPFGKEIIFDYDVDSDDEWEEEVEPGESLTDSEGEGEEKEPADDYEVDNEFLVPHGYLSDEEGEKDEDERPLSPSAAKEKLKLKEEQFERELKEKTCHIKPSLIGCCWSDDQNHEPQLLKVLQRNAAVVSSTTPIKLGCSELICESGESPMADDSVRSENKASKRLVSDSDVPFLIRLLHGSSYSKATIVKEFQLYLERNRTEENKNGPSKAQILAKIAEIGSWSKCTEAGAMNGRTCWLVQSDVLDRYNLTELSVINTLEFATETKKQGRKADDSRTDEDTPPAKTLRVSLIKKCVQPTSLSANRVPPSQENELPESGKNLNEPVKQPPTLPYPSHSLDAKDSAQQESISNLKDSTSNFVEREFDTTRITSQGIERSKVWDRKIRIQKRKKTQEKPSDSFPKVRQNYHEESEASINKQINIELSAHYQYLAMASYFDRDDVALKGFAKFFKESAEEEHEHAQKLMKYQNLRGGKVVFSAINRPSQQEWSTPLVAFEFVLNLEKQVNQSLLDLHKVASGHNDAHLTNYLEEHFLDEQVESINKLAKHHTNLVRVGDGLGVFLYDKELDEKLFKADTEKTSAVQPPPASMNQLENNGVQAALGEMEGVPSHPDLNVSVATKRKRIPSTESKQHKKKGLQTSSRNTVGK